MDPVAASRFIIDGRRWRRRAMRCRDCPWRLSLAVTPWLLATVAAAAEEHWGSHHAGR